MGKKYNLIKYIKKQMSRRCTNCPDITVRKTKRKDPSQLPSGAICVDCIAPGIKHKGVDGNMWVVKEDKRTKSKKRWALLSAQKKKKPATGAAKKPRKRRARRSVANDPMKNVLKARGKVGKKGNVKRTRSTTDNSAKKKKKKKKVVKLLPKTCCNTCK